MKGMLPLLIVSWPGLRGDPPGLLRPLPLKLTICIARLKPGSDPFGSNDPLSRVLDDPEIARSVLFPPFSRMVCSAERRLYSSPSDLRCLCPAEFFLLRELTLIRVFEFGGIGGGGRLGTSSRLLCEP